MEVRVLLTTRWPSNTELARRRTRVCSRLTTGPLEVEAKPHTLRGNHELRTVSTMLSSKA